MSGRPRSRRGPLSIGAALLLASLVAGLMGPAGCALDASGLATVAKSCADSAECDDANPCTDDVCESKLCEHRLNTYVPDDHNDCTVDSCASGNPVNDGKLALSKKCGVNGTLTCDGKGNCRGCTADADCQASSECQKWSCNATTKICDPQYAQVGTKATDATPTDCKGTFCDGKGGTLETPLPLNTTCDNMNGGKFCDGKGQCYPCVQDSNCSGLNPRCDPSTHTCSSCDDMMKNGDETGVDCGGSKCGKCKGDPCGGGTGTCAGAFTCVDGVCCDDACAGTCQACNLPGMAGTCANVGIGSFDQGTCGGPTKVCNGMGACLGNVGEPCAGPNDCYNGACRAGLCRRDNGASCGDRQECLSNRSVNGICQPCAVAADCPGSSCVGGICLGSYGDPCAGGGDCTNGKCTFGLCLNPSGDPCTMHDTCFSQYCKSNVCTDCGGASDCKLPTAPACQFVNGVSGTTTCARKAPAYCNPTYPYECQSWNLGCSGFPAKCK